MTLTPIQKRILLIVAFIAVFGAGFLAAKNTTQCPVCKPEAVNFSLFWDAYNKLHEHYIDSNIDEKKLIYGAIAGMTRSLGDPYTDFFNPEQAKMFQQDLAGSFDGIGVEIALKKEQLTVVAPLKGMPGERAGLLAGDQIVKINGKSTFECPLMKQQEQFVAKKEPVLR